MNNIYTKDRPLPGEEDVAFVNPSRLIFSRNTIITPVTGLYYAQDKDGLFLFSAVHFVDVSWIIFSILEK